MSLRDERYQQPAIYGLPYGMRPIFPNKAWEAFHNAKRFSRGMYPQEILADIATRDRRYYIPGSQTITYEDDTKEVNYGLVLAKRLGENDRNQGNIEVYLPLLDGEIDYYAMPIIAYSNNLHPDDGQIETDIVLQTIWFAYVEAFYEAHGVENLLGFDD